MLGTEVLIIGGGATGLGAAWDAALRGFKVLLVEKGDLANGTSGRYHGLLHSGGRYVLTDPVSARDCARENQILRRIVPEAIEDCGGLFVATPADPPEFADEWAAACRETGVTAEEIPPGRALQDEPLLNPRLSRAFRVADAGCDSFDLCHALARSAQTLHAKVWTRHKLTGLILEGGRVRGAELESLATGERKTVLADMVLNCTGAWAGQVAALAGCQVRILPSKGVMLAMNSRLVNRAVNRLHPPGDGDILVPVGTVSIIGTTDTPITEPDRYGIEPWEIDLMLEQGEVLIPGFKQFRALRAWAGVRPLFQPMNGDASTAENSQPSADRGLPVDSESDTRRITRAHAVLDHAERDGVEGLISVVGGKLTTFRLMAQEALDLACRKLKVERACRTREEHISPRHQTFYHLGQRLERLRDASPGESLICECELVTRAQVESALHASGSAVLNDLRRDLRLGMGPCQGGFCIYRAAGILFQSADGPEKDGASRRPTAVAEANSALAEYLQERWKGIRPMMWGQSVRQLELDLRIYRGILGVDRLDLAREPEAYPTERTA